MTRYIIFLSLDWLYYGQFETLQLIQRKMKLTVVFIIFFCLSSLGLAQPPSGELNSGKFPIGFKSFLIKDYSRSYGLDFEAKNFRPIQVNLWYPVREGTENSELMLDTNYLFLKSDITKSLSDFSIREMETLINNESHRLSKMGIPADEINKNLKRKSGAILNADLPEDEMPLIIFSPSMLSHSVSNVRMCEFLASMGYIVASHASFGINNELMTTQFNDLDNQAKDIEFILNFLQHFELKITKIGLVGHSWGSMAAILVAARNNNINSVCSLDGSEEQWKELIFNSTSFEVMNFKIPFLRLALMNNINFGFYSSLHNSKLQAIFSEPELKHFSFVAGTTKESSIEEQYLIPFVK